MLCGTIMLAIDPCATVVAVVILTAIEEEPEVEPVEPAETPSEEPTANDGGGAAPEPLLEG